SQRLADAAIAGGRFHDEITPAPGRDERGRDVDLDRDEHPRPGVTEDKLAKLPVVFGDVEGHPGIITAGSASGITDGAAALVLMTADAARQRGLPPIARVVDWATTGVDPRVMGIGPVPAVRRLLDKTGLEIEDFDLVELNEAFAPQVLAVLR